MAAALVVQPTAIQQGGFVPPKGSVARQARSIQFNSPV